MSRLWGDPGNLCLVVLDVETCLGPDNTHRVVSVGVAVARRGGVKDRREVFVNPGCPVDAVTAGIHHITDEHLADEPPLAEVWSEIANFFAGGKGETVVLAAHRASFDIPVLRDELERTGGEPLPDLPVLDTAGILCSLAGVRTAKRSLEAIAIELGVVNARPHNALSDATATAEIARLMLDRAEAAGHDHLGDLLAETGSERTGSVRLTVPRGGPKRDRMAPVRTRLPDDHVAPRPRDRCGPAGSRGRLRCAALWLTYGERPTRRHARRANGPVRGHRNPGRHARHRWDRDPARRARTAACRDAPVAAHRAARVRGPRSCPRCVRRTRRRRRGGRLDDSHDREPCALR